MNTEIKNRIELINSDVLPKGYKRTKVGIVPNSWDFKTINEIAEINPSKVAINENIYVSFIGMTDVSEESKIIKNHKKDYQEVSTGYTSFKENDILLAKITPCFENGKGAVATNLYNGIGFGSTEFHVIRVKKNSDRDLIYFHIVSKKFREKGKKHMEGSAGHKRVPANYIENYVLPYPNNSFEKQKIVNIVSTWDKAIELKEKIINEKMKQKKGLLQRILTGKTRIKGFTQEWKEKKIGDYFTYFSKKNKDNKDYEILSCTKNNGIMLQKERFDKRIASKDLSRYKVVEKDDLIYDTMLLWDGSIGFLEVVDIGVISPAYYTFKIDKSIGNKDFFKYLFNSYYMKEMYKKISRGTNKRRKKAPRDSFLDIKIKVPGLEEQKAIAEVLSTADKEIELLKQEVKVLKKQKKGLMQLLLTGKVRVNVDSKS